jgi:hypothetical protein
VRNVSEFYLEEEKRKHLSKENLPAGKYEWHSDYCEHGIFL